MVVVMYLALLLALAGHSSAASYCLCKDGLSDAALQKSLDYACGAGADCTPIIQNGACFQPNTVKDHCNYAVNSYYQRKGQAVGSCDFSGTATVSANPPSSVASGCVYPASPSTTGIGTTTPTTGTGTPTTGTGTGTPTTGTGTGTPTTGTGIGTGTGTGIGTSTGTGTGTGIAGVTPSPFVGLGPTGSGTNIDNSGVAPIAATNMLLASLSLWFSGLVLLFWG